MARGIRIRVPCEWGVSAKKGLLWKEGVVFSAAPTVEALRPSRRSDLGGLVLLGCRGGTHFPSYYSASELNVIRIE